MLQKKGQIYKYQMFDNKHIFNKGLMNIQIEGWNPDVSMDFDDIFCIKTSCYNKKTIDNIPRSMQHLEITISNLEEIPLFPACIQTVKLINSKINIDDKGLQDLRELYPKAFINITTFDCMGFNDTHEIHHQEQAEIMRQNLQRRDIVNNLHPLNNNQTVHVSSINECIVKAIDIIKRESKKYTRVSYPVEELYYDGSTSFFMNMYKNLNNERDHLKSEIKIWCRDEIVHSIQKITFRELLTMIMTIVKNHPQKDDMKERIKIELQDSVGLCFTGRMNRLVNSLVGFVDGIQIGLSPKEEIKMRIDSIVQSLLHKKIKKEEAKKCMHALFDTYVDTTEEEGLSENIKKSYFLALDDFEDD